MKISEALRHFIISVQPVYDSREAENIFRIIHEDIFQNVPDISDEASLHLNNIIERLKASEPIQYILGEADFFGLKFKVTPAVLIPRPETEELVNAVIQETKKSDISHQPSTILDIGTGSGCIPVTLKKNLPESVITAIDVSEDALTVAKENAERNNVAVNFKVIDFLNENNWNDLGMYNVIVSNPPYITEAEFKSLDKCVVAYEPQTALIAPHADPFIFYRKIAAFAQTHVYPKGTVFLELNAVHATEIEIIFSQLGYKTILLKDLQGKNRMLKAWVDIKAKK
jgi:release factor glutamine methyltransferase